MSLQQVWPTVAMNGKLILEVSSLYGLYYYGAYDEEYEKVYVTSLNDPWSDSNGPGFL